MAKHIVKCRICKQEFATEDLEQGKEWIMPSRNYYYHTRCYQTWVNGKDSVSVNDCTEDDWFNIMWAFFKLDLRCTLDTGAFMMIKRQWDNFVADKKTPKGIYFTLKYFYEVKHAPTSDLPKYGIGIVKTLYAEACQYWVECENRKSGILKQLQQEAMAKAEQTLIQVRSNNTRRARKTVDLSIVENEVTNS